jgi:phosphatidylglycerol lysyltransferase
MKPVPRTTRQRPTSHDGTLPRPRPQKRVAEVLRNHPVTAILVVLLVVVSAADQVVRVTGTDGRVLGPLSTIGVLRPLSSVAVTSGFAGALLAVLGIVVCVGLAERVMGSLRTLGAFVVTTAVGTAATALAVVLDADGGDRLTMLVGRATVFDPWTAIIGTVTTASAFCSALWRRRIRIIALAGSAAMLLYAGHAVDLAAVLSAAAGLGLGELLHRGPRRPGWARSSHRETRVLLATVVLVSAVGPFIALASRARIGLLAPVAAVLGSSAVSGAPHCRVATVTESCAAGLRAFHTTGPFGLLFAVAPLILLAAGGVGLIRGSRLALWSVVVVDVVTGIAAASYYGIFVGATVATVGARPAADQVAVVASIVMSFLVPLVTAGVLVARRRDFRVRVGRGRLVGFVGTIGAAAVVLGVSVVVIAMLTGARVNHPIAMALAVLGPLTPDRVADVGEHGRPVLRIAVEVAGPILWLVVAAALARALRVVQGQDEPGRSDRAEVRALARQGGGTFAWMTTWAGNDYWFSPDRRAAFAYRRTGRVAVTLGGPVGHADATTAAWGAFARHCDDLGWTPVFYGVEPDDVSAFAADGWTLLPVAENADIDPRTWTTAGKRKQDVRTSVNRAGRDGIRAEWHAWADLTPSVARQITALSEEWVADRELPEMGFTLGGLDEMHDPAVRILVALDAEDTVLGVTSWLPSLRNGVLVGWTLDVMRRAADAPNGVMEFLVADAVARAAADGLERVGLSAAPLASADEPAAGATASVLDVVGGVLEPVYGFRSLLRFKAKFGPEFRPLVMAFPDPVALPSIGVAIARAYLPDLSVRGAIGLLRPGRAAGSRSVTPRNTAVIRVGYRASTQALRGRCKSEPVVTVHELRHGPHGPGGG